MLKFTVTGTGNTKQDWLQYMLTVIKDNKPRRKLYYDNQEQIHIAKDFYNELEEYWFQFEEKLAIEKVAVANKTRKTFD